MRGKGPAEGTRAAGLPGLPALAALPAWLSGLWEVCCWGGTGRRSWCCHPLCPSVCSEGAHTAPGPMGAAGEEQAVGQAAVPGDRVC